MLSQQTADLIAVVSDDSSDQAQINSAAQAFLVAAQSGADAEDIDEAVRKLSRYFELPDPKRAAFLALICGAMIERGADPLSIAVPLQDRLASLLICAGRLAAACNDRMPDPKAADDGEDPWARFDELRQELAATMPRETACWDALTTFWRPTIAVWGTSPGARKQARSLRELTEPLADFHEGCHWLTAILGVLDDEPIIAIEPDTELGIRGRISGVVDNFQLHVLLMDTFPVADPSAPRRVTPDAAATARGDGPQQTNDVLTGHWNMYTAQAVQPDATLPAPTDFEARRDWIWHEGTPLDIPVIDGHRIILLGPPSMERTWRNQRTFGELHASLTIDAHLTPPEIRTILQRLAAGIE